jgi:prolyl 4-hydroxylase
MIENITGIPERNYEYGQLVRYSPGQYYSTHNDYLSEHQHLPMGPRILTFYVYLSAVDEGGGTEFPDVGLTVQPKPGRAVLWPSVLAEFPANKDTRSRHAALPVVKGVKYGLNLWIHLKDFKSAYERWCT